MLYHIYILYLHLCFFFESNFGKRAFKKIILLEYDWKISMLYFLFYSVFFT